MPVAGAGRAGPRGSAVRRAGGGDGGRGRSVVSGGAGVQAGCRVLPGANPVVGAVGKDGVPQQWGAGVKPGWRARVSAVSTKLLSEVFFL